ncbi:MAG: hypothetical protein HUJ75_04105 [Parasporobacterium sp.]|nr:hypothetical protein [Parasporobacterium sp.]
MKISKLKKKNGETLIETLASVLIITVVFMGIITCILAANRMNARTKALSGAFEVSASAPVTSSVRVRGVKDINNQANSIQVSVNEYTSSKVTNRSYKYYEPIQ